MKVGVFLVNMPPEEGGGYSFEGELLHSLAKLAATTDHSFVIFTLNKKAPQPLVDNQIQVICVHRHWITRAIRKLYKTTIGIFKKLADPMRPFKLAHWAEPLILRSGVEILWYLTPTCPTAELPYITIVWDLAHRLQPYFPEVSVNGSWDEREQIFRNMLQRASIIIAGTEAGRAEIERFYQIPSERIELLPHPTPKFALEASPDDGKHVLEKYNIPKDYLFYPAQFWSHKNHAGLLLAVKWLRDNYDLVLPVIFVGSDKGNQQYIKEMVVDLGLSTQVYFLGYVSQDELIALYRNAFCLTYMTFGGPENLPPLEAFALGCPVVASEVTGAQEQLGDAALLVDPKDTEQIASAIKSLWDDPNLRQTFVQRGLERAYRFTGQDFVKGVFEILDSFEPIRRSWSSKEPYHPN